MGIKSSTISSIEELKEIISKPVNGISVVVANVPSREANAQSLSAIYEAMKSI